MLRCELRIFRDHRLVKALLVGFLVAPLTGLLIPSSMYLKYVLVVNGIFAGAILATAMVYYLLMILLDSVTSWIKVSGDELVIHSPRREAHASLDEIETVFFSTGFDPVMLCFKYKQPKGNGDRSLVAWDVDAGIARDIMEKLNKELERRNPGT